MENAGRNATLVMSLGALLLSGCHIETHKDGKNDNVSIGTPFGSMDVKTNDSVNNAAIGITQYPGSAPFKDKDEDNDSADVNMSFGSFHLGVKAASFQTPDGQDKVVAFYRNDLKRYGDVIECRGHSTVGKPDRTAQGLTCDDDGDSKHMHVGHEAGVELKTGSPQRQHVVEMEAKNGGTKIGLVALELPMQVHNHDDKDIE